MRAALCTKSGIYRLVELGQLWHRDTTLQHDVAHAASLVVHLEPAPPEREPQHTAEPLEQLAEDRRGLAWRHAVSLHALQDDRLS